MVHKHRLYPSNVKRVTCLDIVSDALALTVFPASVHVTLCFPVRGLVVEVGVRSSQRVAGPNSKGQGPGTNVPLLGRLVGRQAPLWPSRAFTGCPSAAFPTTFGRAACLAL